MKEEYDSILADFQRASTAPIAFNDFNDYCY